MSTTKPCPDPGYRLREVQEDDRDRVTLSAEFRRCPSLDEQEAAQCRRERVRYWKRPGRRARK